MTNAPQPIDWPVRVKDKKLDPLAKRNLWPLNHPSLSSSGAVKRLALSSSIKFSSTDKAGRCCYLFVHPAWPIRKKYHVHLPLFLSLCSLKNLVHGKWQRWHCTDPIAPFKVSRPQTKLFQRWVMRSTGPYWIYFEDNPGVLKDNTMANFTVRSGFHMIFFCQMNL